ncbi:MAG: zinc ribbon domain-containing protein [Thermoplasmatales archaeon]|nr:zinc ribbon domain-containing protein [Thermoplasmatales archaeon]
MKRIYFLALILFFLIVFSTVNIGVSEETNNITYSEDDINIVNSTYTIEDTYWKQDGNISVKNGTLILRNATLEFIQDAYHRYSLSLTDNSTLIMERSLLNVTTKQLSPYLKFNLTIKDSDFTTINSTITFPGYINIINSNASINKTIIDRIKELPSGFDAEEIDENDDCPYLLFDSSSISVQDSVIGNYSRIFFNSSTVLITDSGIKNCHELSSSVQDFVPFTENLTENDGRYIDLKPSDTLNAAGFWNKMKIPNHRLTAAVLETTYITEPFYNGTEYIQYSKDGVDYHSTSIQPLNIEKAGIESYTETYDLWAEGLRTVEDIEKLRIRFSNNDPFVSSDDDNDSIVHFDHVRVVVAFENDIVLINTSMYALNTYFDVDFREADADPIIPGVQKPTTQNHLENCNPQHNTVRVLDNSMLWLCNVTVDLSETENAVPDVGDPPFLTDETSNVYIYRMLKVNVSDNAGVPVNNATVQIKCRTNITDKNTLPGIILDYLGKNRENYNKTDAGSDVLLLLSDKINVGTWPNSNFVGNYMVNAVYEEHSFSVDISFPQFPQITVADNSMEISIKVSNLTMPPTSIALTAEISKYYCKSGEKLVVSGKAAYNTGENVVDATITVTFGDKQYTGETNADGTYSIDVFAPKRGSYTVDVSVADPVYKLSSSAPGQTVVVKEVVEPVNIMPFIIGTVVIIAVIVIVFIFRKRLTLAIYILKAKMMKEKFVECSECGATIPATAKKCPRCGTEFEEEVVKCSQCGSFIPRSAENCPKCGVKFD